MLTEEKKAARIERAMKHAELDRLMAGTYVQGSRGCSVGCDAIDILGADKAASDGTDYHAVVAEHDGTSEWLEHLRDAVFEGLPADKRSWWHVELAKALPAGRDFNPFYHKIQVAILDISLRSIAGNNEPYAVECRAAIETVQHMHRTAAATGEWDESAESAAESAARSAWSAAWSAARSAESAARRARGARRARRGARRARRGARGARRG